MVPELHVRCLGRLSLHGSEVPSGTDRELRLPATLKSQSLLVFLIIHRHQAHSRASLAELFWGDHPERRARRSLSTALWQIHHCLPGDDFLLADAADVQFNPRPLIWLDVAEFEQLAVAALHSSRPATGLAALQGAVALYRGDFMEGFGDEWVLSQRYQLENLYHDALARLMLAHAEQGEHAPALAAALRLLARDPLREDAHQAAMRAYCHLGQRHAALAQYSRCRALLHAELGIEPLPETTSLCRAIAEGHLVCAAEAVTLPVLVTAAPRRPVRSPLDASGHVPLVGRAQELEVMHAAWRAGLAGQSSLLLISGEAGVGKTRLVQEFADQKRWQGVRVLQGCCYEFERQLPYQPLADALQALPLDAAAAACAQVPEWVTAQVRRLVPDLGEPNPDQTGLLTASDGARQEQLFQGLSRFLAGLADRQPLLLILEDLHWAGDSTLLMLHYLARYLVAHPLLLVGTLRPEALSPASAAATLGRRLVRDGLAWQLQLHPLSAATVLSLIEQLSAAGEAAQALADRLYRETEGNPFYVIETLKSLFETGTIWLAGGSWQMDTAVLDCGPLPLPPNVSDMIGARIDRLAERTQDAVHLAAVVGRTFNFDLLCAAWGQGEDATLAAVDDLLRQQLVAEMTDGGNADYAFTHHQIQQVVYAGLSRHRRQHLHGQVGLALEALLGAGVGPRAAELAFHFEQAQHLDRTLADRAIAYLLQASQQAMRQSASQEAVAFAQRGLDIVYTLPETAQRLRHEIDLRVALALPTAVVHGFGSPEARCAYEKARQLCRQYDDSHALFATRVGLARYYALTGDLATAVELAAMLIASAEVAGHTDWLVEALCMKGGIVFALGRLREARALLLRGMALYDPADQAQHTHRFGHDPAVAMLNYLNLALWLLGYSTQALLRFQQLETLAQALAQPTSQVLAQCMLAKGACMRRDAETAVRFAQESIRLGQRYGQPFCGGMASVFLGWALCECGEQEHGLAQLRAGTTAWRAMGNWHFTPFLLALQAEAALKARRLELGQSTVVDALAMAAGGGDTYWLAELHRLHGELLWAEGRDDDAVAACFMEALTTARRQEARMLELRAGMSLARLWQSQGRILDARQLLTGVVAQFDEGINSPDLRAAGSLIRALA